VSTLSHHRPAPVISQARAGGRAKPCPSRTAERWCMLWPRSANVSARMGPQNPSMRSLSLGWMRRRETFGHAVFRSKAADGGQNAYGDPASSCRGAVAHPGSASGMRRAIYSKAWSRFFHGNRSEFSEAVFRKVGCAPSRRRQPQFHPRFKHRRKVGGNPSHTAARSAGWFRAQPASHTR